MTPIRLRRGPARDRGGDRAHDRAGVPLVRRGADRSRVDRSGAPRHPADGRRGRRQGAAPRGAASDRVRSAAHAVGRPRRARARALPSTSSMPRRSSTSSAARSGRSSTTSTRRGTPRRSGATSATRPRSSCPKVIWRYSSARVLTLEFLEGTQFADLDLERASPEERRELAYRMTDAWMTMIFRHGFFHGDPHPGEHPPARRRPHRARRLRARGTADRRGHDAADAPLHRRGHRERRCAASPPGRARAALSRRSARTSCARRSRISSTATTARACPASIRSR